MRENLSVGFQNRSDINESVQPQSIDKSSKFQIEKKRGIILSIDLLAFIIQLICIFV